MAMQIDWSALQRGPNIGETVQKAFEQGRARGALRAFASDPTNQQARADLYSLSPEVALRMDEGQQRQAEYQIKLADAQRKSQARALVPDVMAGAGMGGGALAPFVGASPQPNALAPDAGQSASPGDITVTAPKPRATIADVYALDPDLASSLATSIGKMHEDQQKQLGAEADAMGIVAHQAAQKPYAERRAIIDTFRPILTRAGFSQAELDDFDPTDDAIGAAINRSLGLKGALQIEAQRREEAERDRHNRATEANSAGSLAVSRGNLNLSRQREARVAKWGPQPMFGNVRHDTDDLNY